MTVTDTIFPNYTLDYFEKPDGKIVVFDHVSSKSFVLSKDLCNILKAIDHQCSIAELSEELPDYSPAEVIKSVEQFVSVDLCSTKGTIDFLPVKLEFLNTGRVIFSRNPENNILIRSSTLRKLFQAWMILSVVLLCVDFIALWHIAQLWSFHINMDCIIPSFFIFCFSLFLHEFSHAVFAKSSGANVCEIGLQIQKTYPFFKFYTDIAALKYIRLKRQKLLLHGSGIMAYCFVIQISWLFFMPDLYYSNRIGQLIVLINMICIIIELIPFPGTDGNKIIFTLFR